MPSKLVVESLHFQAPQAASDSREVTCDSSTNLHSSGYQRWISRFQPLNTVRLALCASSISGVAGAGSNSPPPSGPNRSLAAAIQNINGMSALFSIIPVLTGKTQNIKLIAARAFPGAMTVAGLGAGRVLTKLQMGLLLSSSNMYQNLVSEFSYHHDEYINKFSPALIHVPTGTPERHSSNVIINHNPAEDYMVETWFQMQGVPAVVTLRQTNNQRLFFGLLIYLSLFAVEVYIGTKNVATDTGVAFVIVQITGAVFWMAAVITIQLYRGQGTPAMKLNCIDMPTFRCFQLVTLGRHVQSTVLSMHLHNLQTFQVFGGKYDNRTLKMAGSLLLVSGCADMLGTILVVGLNRWAYVWLGWQVLILFTKVGFSLEPLRQISIKDIYPINSGSAVTAKTRLPLVIITVPEYSFVEVGIQGNIVEEVGAAKRWQSHSPGVYIGQPYYHNAKIDPSDLSQALHVRYLALSASSSGTTLTLQDTEPPKESNQALQREFLAGLAEAVKANKIASPAFISAVEQTMEGVRATMEPQWFAFGTKDLQLYTSKCKIGALWRRFI
jgi:hypothetical protein